MNKIVVELANAIHWDRAEGDKVYLDNVHIAMTEFPFATRQVHLRFANGPGLDLSIVDMDRIAIEYLKLRGVKLPAKLSALANVAPPPRCDFIVPSQLMDELSKGKDATVRPPLNNCETGKRRKQSTQASHAKQKKRRCARCRQRSAASGEWYGDLCPECADKTQGEWVCEDCGRHGDFEAMGSSGSINPVCCGSPCKHIKDE